MGRAETYDTMGFSLTWPDVFEDTKGLVMPMAAGENNGLYLMLVSYMALTKEELEAINASTAEGKMSDEVRDKVINSTGPMLMVIGIDASQGPKEIREKMKMESEADAAQFIELARHSDKVYYAVKDLDGEKAFLQKQNPSFAEEFHTLQAALIEALKNAEYFKPRIPGADLIGRKLSFETKDTDGNTVRSEALFAAHSVTMVNLWATWCGPCKSELKELGNIHRRIIKKDAAIVGICSDADEKADECRELMAQNNMTYINLLPFADLDQQLPASGIPTSFFVNREGKIMTYPVIGVPADISQYEKTVDEMLAGVSGGSDPVTQENSSDPSRNSYRIVIKDEAGKPVEGVSVQFCSDTACMMAKTDTQGTASFDAEDGQYTVHVQKVPAGYALCPEEFEVPQDHSGLEITLKKPDSE